MAETQKHYGVSIVEMLFRTSDELNEALKVLERGQSVYDGVRFKPQYDKSVRALTRAGRPWVLFDEDKGAYRRYSQGGFLNTNSAFARELTS